MYEDLRKDVTIETFELIQFALPTVVGTCTLPGSNLEGWYTPPTCQETNYGSAVHWFSTQNAPFTAGRTGNLKAEAPIHRVVKSVKETPTELKPGKGLSARGSLVIILKDFPGDPGPTRTTEDGTYLGKMKARNVMVNRPIQVLMGIVKDGVYNLEDFQVKNYVIESMDYQGNDHWKLTCKDELYHLNKDEAVWPPEPTGYLRTDIDDSTTTIPVDELTDYSTAEVVIINKEFMRVISVTNNLTPTAELSVGNRGSDIKSLVDTNITITKTEKSTHDLDDAVFICKVSDGETLDEALIKMLTESGIDISLIPQTDWADEILAWYPDFKLYTLWYESLKVNEQLVSILEPFLLDLWFDSVDRLIRLSAISVWQNTVSTVTEGHQIDAYSLKIKERNELRYTRSSIQYDKKFLAETDDSVTYSKVSRYVNTTLEEPGLYGEVKLFQFPPSHLPDRTRADLLNQRFVQRFGDLPIEYDWMTQERFLDFKIGDIVGVSSSLIQGYSGVAREVRAQILSIVPDYNFTGRQYRVKGLVYADPQGGGGPPSFTLTGRQFDLNLYVLAGGPAEAVEVTFVFDAVELGSSVAGVAMVAGQFAEGSIIHIICINGTKLRAQGGRGGQGGRTLLEAEPGVPNIVIPGFPGDNGDSVYDAQGIESNLYLSGTYDNGQIYNCDGTFYSPGGGGFGGDPDSNTASAGGGGGGGTGQLAGSGGSSSEGSPAGYPSSPGTDGDENGGVGTGGAGSTNGGLDGYDGGSWGRYGGASRDDDSRPGILITTGGAEVNVITDSLDDLNARMILGDWQDEIPSNLDFTNLLTSPEWLTGIDGVPVDWTIFGGSSDKMFITGMPAGDGSTARLSINPTAPTAVNNLGVVQTVNLPVGDYSFVVYVDAFSQLVAGDAIADMRPADAVGPPPGLGTELLYNGVVGRQVLTFNVPVQKDYLIFIGPGADGSTVNADIVMSRPWLTSGLYAPRWSTRGGS